MVTITRKKLPQFIYTTKYNKHILKKLGQVEEYFTGKKCRKLPNLVS